MRDRRRRALQSYRQWAASYDLVSAVAGPIRRRAVDRLDLRPGDVVLDVGCGTGLSFPLIEDRIGPQGRLVGVDLSPDMLDEARRRVRRHRWDNVTLLCAAARDAQIPVRADAALFCLVHDILRSPRGLENTVAHLKPGARVVAAGAKWAPWWAPAVNLTVWVLNRPFVTTFQGFRRPWEALDRHVPDLQVEILPAYLAGAYIAWGTTRLQ
ncbi:MAG: methyltransferase domain-containing protein [Actinomycetota bacterium]|nr:methyltransferase domain-containing protein [Actinomycetota bacterium]